MRKRSVLALLMLALAGSAAPARAYTMPVGTRDAAMMYRETASRAVGMNVTDWGTTYYGDIPPQEQGGLGDRVVCLGYSRFDSDVEGHGCFDGVNFEFERLQSLLVEDSFVIELSSGDGSSLGTETAALSVTLTAVGPAYPGGRAQLIPSPGAEAEYSVMRDVVVEGTLVTPTMGTVSLDGTGGVIEHDQCVGLMAGPDNVEACRF